MRQMACGMVVAVAMAACSTNAFAQSDFRNYGLFQVGGTTGEDATGQVSQQPKLAIGADFGQALNRHVEIYLAGGWQEEVQAGLRDTLHLTSGVKFMLTRDTYVRPYLIAGAGVMHFRTPEVLALEGKSKFLTEVGGGFAFPVGTQGYIDIGYRFFKPYNAPDFTPNGVFAGFGFRY